MEGKQVTLKLTPREVATIREALEKHHGSVTDANSVDTALTLVRFRQHDLRVNNKS